MRRYFASSSRSVTAAPATHNAIKANARKRLDVGNDVRSRQASRRDIIWTLA